MQFQMWHESIFEQTISQKSDSPQRDCQPGQIGPGSYKQRGPACTYKMDTLIDDDNVGHCQHHDYFHHQVNDVDDLPIAKV